LGAYLLHDKNERAEVWDIRGDLPRDLRELLADWRSDTLGSACQKPLYHAQLNPDRPLSREEWNTAIAIFEKEMGFQHQPRAVVFHEYKGRGHVHLVYSRLDETGKAISDSWNYLRHEKAARGIEQALGMERIQGALYERERGPRPERTPSRGAVQQGERTGHDPQTVRQDITALYRSAGGNAATFAASLERHGYRLARGDRRGLVVVDTKGGIHSLSRASGAKAGELRAMFHGYAALPGVVEAKAMKPAPQEAPPPRPRSITDDPVLKRHKKQIMQNGAVQHRGLVGKWHEQEAEWRIDHERGISDPPGQTIRRG
jgi:hypothetical protein